MTPTQKELDKLDERFDHELWAKLIRLRHPVDHAPESVGGGGFGPLGAVGLAGGTGPSARGDAVPRVDHPGRRRVAVRLGRAAIRVGRHSGRRQQDRRARALDGEMSQGPVQATGSDEAGYKLTGTRTQVAYGPVADAFLVPAESDSGVKVFLVAAADSPAPPSPRWTPPVRQRRAPGSAGCGRRR